jgi:myosin-5
MKARHVRALPYTRTGDIVIAVNPYQWLTYLYTEEQQLLYAKKLVWDNCEMDNRKILEPHVYETSALAYRGLAVDGASQSLLVSGESGAGKTETVKICMNHMASLQRGPITAGDTSGGVNPVVQRVVDSNPLLESFGNAKTRRNDNSSRFGKYIQLQFDRDDNAPLGSIPATKLAGSKCEVYLLEKSRVVTHDITEGTYHVLFQLCAASEARKAEVWSGLKGTNYDSFKFVGSPQKKRNIDGMEDSQHYEATCTSLGLVGCEGEDLMTLMRSIAVVLQLGNITFGILDGDNEQSCVTSPKEFTGLCELIGLSEKELGPAFTERTMATRGETFKVPLKADAAKDGCDAYAKEIYAKLFLWLVRMVNAATCAEENYDGERKTDFGTIGLLDIFGFESFPINGFEQLCINYANEKLQQKFTKDIFCAVQEEYKFEGIDLADITYDDNSDVLELIESRSGLLAMLNEECVRPKGSDKEFVYKAKEGNKKSACLIADRIMGPMDFGIHHYAGKVCYFAEGFIARNQDTLAGDIVELSKKSSNDIIANHLTNEKMMMKEYATSGPAKVSKAAPKRGKSGIASDTLWTKFRTQLNALMANLNLTQSRYIRCVKPNTLKQPCVMQHMTTIEQLRCAGVVAAVTISRSAFPNRLDHRSCIERFKVLVKAKKGESTEKLEPKDEVVRMLTTPLESLAVDGKPAFVVGKTRVYFKMGALEYLEAKRMEGWDQWALDIQRVTRGWLQRRVAQAAMRKKKAGERGPRIIPIQCWWRCLAAKKEVKKRKKAIKAKKKNKKKGNKSAITIQAHVRGWLWRPKFKAMLKEQRAKDGLKNKIKELEDAVKETEKKRLAEVETAREAADAEMEAYRLKVKEDVSNDKEKQKKSAQQQTLIEESGKIIEYLRKENSKLRTQNESMRKDFKSLKENNQRLMEANASAGQSFTALNDHAKQLNVTNAKLMKNVEAYKMQLEKFKDDLKTRQAYYLAEAEARLAYQKTMAQIVGAVQDKCRDAQLVEDVVIMALECEAEAKSERAALEAASSQSKAKAPAASVATPSVAKTEVSAAESDSDSDSDDD